MGFVRTQYAQFPETSAEEGNTWVERDCLERGSPGWPPPAPGTSAASHLGRLRGSPAGPTGPRAPPACSCRGSLQGGHALALRLLAVAAAPAVVRAVVPLAGEHAEALWIEIKDDTQQILVSPRDGILVLLVQTVQHDLPGQTCWDHAALEERKHHSS